MSLHTSIFSRITLFVLFGLLSNTISAQVFLYLEDMTQVKAIKIPEGSRISIKTTENKKWTSYTVDKLIPDTKIIVHSDGYILLDEITHIRRQRRWVRALGTSLESFGVGWGLYGAVALAANLPFVEPTGVIIGTLVPLAAGWLMKKIWLWKNYKIGSKNRLKILDLSFPDDPYGVKKQKTYYP